MAKVKNAYATAFSVGANPQTEAIIGREVDMKRNNAGGMTFTITPFQMLERFLILGSETSTYYTSAKNLTKDNATNIRECLTVDGRKTVDMIVGISVSGRAPKNDPALFALAVAATPSFGSQETAQYALSQMSKVARYGTDLFHFATYLKTMRGWGRSVKRAFGEWYTERPSDSLAYQLVKYQNRDGWDTKANLALAHVKGTDKGLDPVKAALLAWGATGSVAALQEQAQTWTRNVKKWAGNSTRKGGLTPTEIAHRRDTYQNAYDILTGPNAPKLIAAYENAKKATTVAEVVNCITDGGLTHEMIPTQFKTSPEVWEALLQKMPMTAMVRNLGTMSKVGLVKPLSEASKLITTRLGDKEFIKKSKIHPLALMLAGDTYGAGHGFRSDASWTVVSTITDALEDAFYLAFANCIPTGKNVYIALDVSGSMSWDSSIIKNTRITAAKAGAAMMLLMARTEKNYCNYAFSTAMHDIGITAKDTLKSAMDKTSKMQAGGTDCSLPMLDAQKKKLDVDAFIVITDNVTYAGNIHPSQALVKYRKSNGKQDSRLIVMGMTATQFSIADPKDPYMFDVVGFDANVPLLITDFIRGKSVNLAEMDE